MWIIINNLLKIAFSNLILRQLVRGISFTFHPASSNISYILLYILCPSRRSISPLILVFSRIMRWLSTIVKTQIDSRGEKFVASTASKPLPCIPLLMETQKQYQPFWFLNDLYKCNHPKGSILPELFDTFTEVGIANDKCYSHHCFRLLLFLPAWGLAMAKPVSVNSFYL